MSGKLSKEEFDLAVTRIHELNITPKSRADIHVDLERILRQAATRERFWASVWELYKVDERNLISKYIKMKRNLEHFHYMMRSRIESSKRNPTFLYEQEIGVIHDIGELLKVDDIILNSTHVLWILRAIHLLRSKRGEPSKSSSSSSFLYGFFLTTLIQVVLLVESNQLEDIVHTSLGRLKDELQAWFTKFKKFFDESSISRIECALNLLNRLQQQSSYVPWWQRYAAIVLDLIRTEVGFLREKMHHDEGKYRASLGLDFFTPEKRGPIEAYLARLEQQHQQQSAAVIRVQLPAAGSTSSSYESFFAGTTLGGFVIST